MIAPKHFHIVAQLTRPAGFVEYMGYSFAFTEPAQLRDRPAVLAKFQSHAFTRIDNSTVPARNWDDWVPRNPHQAGEQEIAARFSTRLQAAPRAFLAATGSALAISSQPHSRSRSRPTRAPT